MAEETVRLELTRDEANWLWELLAYTRSKMPALPADKEIIAAIHKKLNDAGASKD